MRRIALVLSLLALSCPGALGEEKKWRWGDGDGSDARQDRQAGRGINEQRRPSGSARYEIFESADGGNFGIPGRPHDFRPPVDYQERPDFGGGFRPGRPGGVYGNGNNGFGQSGYGGGGAAGILTGPVPSWQREPPYKEFDKCKCTEKFNCPSPGVSYGQCDVGKKYCCHSTQGSLGGPLPSRPVHSIQNGILSGPGGPVDYIPGGGRPPIGNGGGYYGPNQDPGVLVGPGGPTGHIGRPPFNPSGEGLYNPRPPHGPGILSGPGGPTGVIGRPPGYGGGSGPGVLVGPGGPTGIVGRPPQFVGGVGGRPPSGYEGAFGVGPAGILVGPGGQFGSGGSGGYGGSGFGGGGFRPSGFGVGRSASPNDNDKLKKE